jgi:hypothetical protein
MEIFGMLFLYGKIYEHINNMYYMILGLSL